MMSRSLEQRIASALASEDLTAAALPDLIAETQTAIDAADKAAEDERTKALDPALSPVPKAARVAMEDAAFTRDRLRTVLPRLQARG
jgi:predicted transcriptional regulator